MNFNDLRSETQDLLDDPSGDVFDVVRAGRLVNMGYEDVAQEVDLCGKAYNIHPTPVALSVTSSAREYSVAPTSPHPPIRKILDVERTDSPRPIRMPMVTWEQRNDCNVSSVYPSLEPRASVVYVYRRSNSIWVVGFIDTEPTTQTLNVWYSPVLDRLSTPSDEPQYVPTEWHSLIALRAALVGKLLENRDAGQLATRYSENLLRMRQSLDRLAAPGRPIRL